MGALKNRSESELRSLISQLIMDGYLCKTTDKYSVIRMGNIAPLKDASARVLVRIHSDGEPERQAKKRSRKSTDSLTKAGYELFEVLRRLRLTIAREEGVPPYIIFSDKTLIDMSAKVPRDRAAMLNVSGVGEAKYEKYGDRFTDAITAFLREHPDAVTSIEADDEVSGEKNSCGRKLKKQKDAFYLNREDGDKFEYRDFSLLPEIRDELNRITSADNVKHLFGTDIFRMLTGRGYVKEQQVEGRGVQIPTELGRSKGIVAAEKTSKAGNVYTVLMYPPTVQKEIVEHYIEIGTQTESRGDAGTKEIEGADRVEYNRKMNRPDGAGTSWTEKEDRQLDDEYRSGMKVSEIAKAHDRTNGAIRARLKKHGLMIE